MMLADVDEVSIIGCGRCAAASLTGGEKQVLQMADKLQAHGKTIVAEIVSGPRHLLLAKIERSDRETPQEWSSIGSSMWCWGAIDLRGQSRAADFSWHETVAFLE
ncbi:MAG: hypothetical protein QMD78_01710 [Methanocellales archaeon]|nr:hypothetical protein [Methanocellales archaeon]